MHKKKTVKDTYTIMTDMVLPPDTNNHNTIFGGRVMSYVDKVACIAAMRHCRTAVVTVSSDQFDFLAPIKVGEAIILEGKVICSYNTSMEVFVKVESEDLYTGERKLTSRAFLTILAIDENGKPCKVPKITPETDEEKLQYKTSLTKYEERKKERSRTK